MSRGLIVGLFLLALTATGCADLAPATTAVEKYDSSSAYLYGNYLVHARGAPSLALEIQSVDDPARVYNVKFRKDRRMVVSKVMPGKYIIKRWLYLSLGNEIQSVEDVYGHPYRVPFDVVKGQAFYMGDHEGSVNFSFGPVTTTITPSLTQAKDSFETSTKNFEDQFPQLRELPKSRAFKK